MPSRPVGLPEGAECPEAILPTDVPGIVLWRYRRRTVMLGDRKLRTRTYSVTHEPSGVALLPGPNRQARHCVSLAQARDVVRKLGDVRWRGKPYDWTQPIDVLKENDRARMSALVLAGWRCISTGYDMATKEWADRNSIDLSFAGMRKTA